MVLEHHESSGPGLKDRSGSLISAPRGPRTEKVMRIPAKLVTRQWGSHGVIEAAQFDLLKGKLMNGVTP